MLGSNSSLVTDRLSDCRHIISGPSFLITGLLRGQMSRSQTVFRTAPGPLQSPESHLLLFSASSGGAHCCVRSPQGTQRPAAQDTVLPSRIVQEAWLVQVQE